MHVVMAASEAAPFAKTGGLADVVGALPGALRRLGMTVSVVLPAYGSTYTADAPVSPTEWVLRVPLSGQEAEARVLRSQLACGVPVYLVEADRYFARAGLYGTSDGDYPDNAERFAFFSRAALALTAYLPRVDVLHCHDWQTALVPAFLRFDAARYPGLAHVRTVLTVHNLGYQGVFWPLDWHLLDLDWKYFAAEWLEFYGKINYLKAGLTCADVLTAVSPSYAEEIQTPEFGCGLDGVLRSRRAALSGILNGADYEVWNPERDPYVAAPYSAADLRGKSTCKADLQTVFGLPVRPRVPVIGMVSRLADQKGLDLLAQIAPALLRKRVQMVILGTGDARYQEMLPALARQHHERLAVRTVFDESLAHKIEAGADVLLMPSRYEPCGLNQIYSMRYGTIPIVHATGGLRDTVTDFDATAGTGTGFCVTPYTAAALLGGIERALKVYRTPRQWHVVMQNAMRADFSCERSAAQYADLYRAVGASPEC